MTAANASVPAVPQPVFSTVLRPYRSLSPRGFGLLMMAIGASTSAAGFAFWFMGAWPVVGFLGLDLLLIQFAFHMNYRAARAAEEISLTPDRLLVRRVSPSGIAVETGFDPYWARLEVDRHPEFGVTGVRIASHGDRLAIARFLGPREREAFADELGTALARLKAAPG